MTTHRASVAISVNLPKSIREKLNTVARRTNTTQAAVIESLAVLPEKLLCDLVRAATILAAQQAPAATGRRARRK